MSETYWQAKIWGILHEPILKALQNNQFGRGDNSLWQDLEVMQEWKEKGWNPETSGKKILEHIHLADYIASASDRGAIGSLSKSINYAPNHDRNQGLNIAHLLSGEQHHFKLKQHSELLENRQNYLQQKEAQLRDLIPEGIRSDSQQLFWWLWRCLPEAACQLFENETLLLMPAETRLPDSSIWSHASLTAALAGALAGYNLTPTDIDKDCYPDKSLSHPFLASFSFCPVQELIKASRKMRDFWAGSWVLHYLSARVSWKLAQQYGPDCLLYPSLYQQPLIDHWLLQQYPEFSKWVKQPRDRALLTAGFPNVLVLILPKDKVEAAMQTARNTLIESWRDLGKQVLAELQDNRHWMRPLSFHHHTWKGWLDAQWQTYWTAIPIGKEEAELKSAAIVQEREEQFANWLEAQNQAYGLTEPDKLFQTAELNFLRDAYNQSQSEESSINVGSWWSPIFDQMRHSLTAVKNARTWQIPTAFGPRSTVSGLGSVVHPGKDWISEGETQNYWQQQAGLFDGKEQLNATETLKRGLEQILPQLLATESDAIAASYPDLTAGVAGYLKVHLDSEIDHQHHFQQACQAIIAEFPWAENAIKEMRNKWGIPWQDEKASPQKYHPRLLNAGWLVEDVETEEIQQLQRNFDREKDPVIQEHWNREIRNRKLEYQGQIQTVIERYYPSNNPTDWYVLAVGDGDGMSEWLKGNKLKAYQDYIPSELSSLDQESFQQFLKMPKRMGPSTHNALSRALLDFSNQLLPYLSERRYAGRLIYGGGDDVLAYTNLWEWDSWLWDIRQCFRGLEDPGNEFESQGNYWRWQQTELPKDVGGNSLLSSRPLFTMGETGSISFGIAIAHHSVPLAITLENLWEAEAEAKAHEVVINGETSQKDAVQVRAIYGNGNILKATAKFEVFNQWQQLLDCQLESSLFEQAATIWSQHPAPVTDAIAPWTKAFCQRREQLQGDRTDEFQQSLVAFLEALWLRTPKNDLNQEIQTWLKLAAFTTRNREIKIK